MRRSNPAELRQARQSSGRKLRKPWRSARLETFWNGLTLAFTDTSLRYTSVSIGFNVAVTLIIMTSPMISTHLISGLGTAAAPAYVIIGASAISLASVVFG